jgi:hypothetical protein
MRKLVALLLPPVIFAQACASSAPRGPVTSLDALSLAAINREVEDQPVAIRLASGEVVKEAEGLTMTAETTSWRGGHDRGRAVPTTEVCQVVRQVRHRAGKGYAWGLLACAPIAIAAGRDSRNDGDLLAGLGALLVTEAFCPFIGMFIGAGLKQPPDRVVYTAPGGCGTAK